MPRALLRRRRSSGVLASLASAKPSSGSKLLRAHPSLGHTSALIKSESRKERGLWLANTLVEATQQRVEKIRDHSAAADGRDCRTKTMVKYLVDLNLHVS
jgi:hypothetical protein